MYIAILTFLWVKLPELVDLRMFIRGLYGHFFSKNKEPAKILELSEIIGTVVEKNHPLGCIPNVCNQSSDVTDDLAFAGLDKGHALRVSALVENIVAWGLCNYHGYVWYGSVTPRKCPTFLVVLKHQRFHHLKCQKSS